MSPDKIILVLGIGSIVAATRLRPTLHLGKVAFESYWLFGWL
jgi:hypothetical protein